MYGKIELVLMEQAKLIEPICKNGTLNSIRIQAGVEYNQINELIKKLKKVNYCKKLHKELIRENRDFIVDCFTAIYTKLGDDSRTLPSRSLRDFAIVEMKSVMIVWEKMNEL